MRCLDYFTLMPVLPEVHFCPVGIVILCSKDIFSYNSMLIYFRCNTAIEGKLASNVKWAMQVASEKGASNWLATIPIVEHGFALTKVHSEMPFAYNMAGDLPIYHFTTSVANTSLSCMH